MTTSSISKAKIHNQSRDDFDKEYIQFQENLVNEIMEFYSIKATLDEKIKITNNKLIEKIIRNAIRERL